MPTTTIIRECPYHGTQESEMGCCPKCAEEVVNGKPFRSVAMIMSSSLEALAARLK